MNIAYILLAYSSLFLLGIIDNSRGPIYPELLNSFEITKAQGSLIFSLASLSGFFISLISRSWLIRWGVLRSTQYAFVFDAIACALMGTVAANMFGYYQFLCAALILGLAMGIKGIALNILIIQSTSAEIRRRVFAGMHSMYGIASLLAPIFLGILFKWGIGWKNYFIFLAILGVVVFFFSFFVKPIQYIFPEKLPANLAPKKILSYCFIFALYVASEILISSRLVVYLNEIGGWDKATASYLLSGFFLCLLAGRVLFSVRTFKHSSHQLLSLSLIISIFISLIGILIYPPLLVLNGLSMSIFFPAGMDWIATSEGKNADYIMAKVMMSVSLGLVIMHFGFGILADFLGLSLSIWIIPLMLLLSWYLLQNTPKNADSDVKIC